MMPGIRRRSRKDVTDKGLEHFLPTSVQKSYFMLSDAEREILNTALGKYQPGECEPILVGGKNALKPALRLMRNYRLAIEEVKDSQAITSYTRWVDAAQVRETENKEVYLTFSPRFERIWVEFKKRLLDFAGQKPADIRLRSKYALRMYSWAKKHVWVGTKRISLDQLRTVLGLDPVKDAEGNVIREGRLTAWANFRQRALNVAITETNKKTDLNIAIESLERSGHRRITALIFAIRSQVCHTLIQKERLRVIINTGHDRQPICNSWGGRLAAIIEALKLTDEERKRRVAALAAGLHLAFARLHLGSLLTNTPAVSVETRIRLLQVLRSICVGL